MTRTQMSKRDRAERAAREHARRLAADERAAAAARKAVHGYRHDLSRADADIIREIRFQLGQERVSGLKVDQLVLSLRANGATWAQIAAALGTSRQAAMKRHARALSRR